MSKKNQPINDTLDKLSELIDSQQTALDAAKSIISMKDKMIRLCEEETAIYVRENRKLQKIILGMSIIFVIASILVLYKLL